MTMRYEHVCLESLGYTLPAEVVTSAELERRLTPLYERLKLPAGRLEMMSGISQRRFWPPETLPSQFSIESGRRALAAAECPPERIGALVHASVCRDFLEPATACRVHHHLNLPKQAVIYDVSNACLGLLNGALQVANMIELGQIQAGLVVGTEGSRQLVETTVDALNQDTALTRQSVKSAIASLTIGSASCAMLLTHSSISRTQNRLFAASAWAETAHHGLCQSGRDEAAGEGMAPLMHTDSERLMHEGIRVGVETFGNFLDIAGLARHEIARTICHQVGGTHRQLMLEALGLDVANDYATFSWLGNTGSVALPITLALAAERGPLGRSEGAADAPEKVALLGIGSGINSVMIAVDWRESRVAGGEYRPQGTVRRRSSRLAATGNR